jgi:lycopene cyclase domain-containing protein
MTYFAFLALFLGIPLMILSIITIVDYQRGKWQPKALLSMRPWAVILGLCVVAFIYTTPWDNYLVATRVWWYDPQLVNGLILGYVPIEEYTFFLLQPIMTGLFALLLMRYLPLNPQPADSVRARYIMTSIFGMIWLAGVVLLLLSFTDARFEPGTYLGLELAWALIPVLLQVGFGGDILLRHARIVVPAIGLSTLYLAAADAVAIGAGTWTIDPAQSFQIYLGGVLPIEEFVFFLLTNTLVVFGLTLVLAEESQPRARRLRHLPLIGGAIERLLPQTSVVLER